MCPEVRCGDCRSDGLPAVIVIVAVVARCSFVTGLLVGGCGTILAPRLGVSWRSDSSRPLGRPPPPPGLDVGAEQKSPVSPVPGFVTPSTRHGALAGRQ